MNLINVIIVLVCALIACILLVAIAVILMVHPQLVFGIIVVGGLLLVLTIKPEDNE
jgi:hypothetical protein